MITTLVILYIIGLVVILICIEIARRNGMFSAFQEKELKRIQYQTEEEKDTVLRDSGANITLGLIYLSSLVWPIIIPIFLIIKQLEK